MKQVISLSPVMYVALSVNVDITPECELAAAYLKRRSPSESKQSAGAEDKFNPP